MSREALQEFSCQNGFKIVRNITIECRSEFTLHFQSITVEWLPLIPHEKFNYGTIKTIKLSYFIDKKYWCLFSHSLIHVISGERIKHFEFAVVISDAMRTLLFPHTGDLPSCCRLSLTYILWYLSYVDLPFGSNRHKHKCQTRAYFSRNVFQWRSVLKVESS